MSELGSVMVLVVICVVSIDGVDGDGRGAGSGYVGWQKWWCLRWRSRDNSSIGV